MHFKIQDHVFEDTLFNAILKIIYPREDNKATKTQGVSESERNSENVEESEVINRPGFKKRESEN